MTELEHVITFCVELTIDLRPRTKKSRRRFCHQTHFFYINSEHFQPLSYFWRHGLLVTPTQMFSQKPFGGGDHSHVVYRPRVSMPLVGSDQVFNRVVSLT